MNRSTPNSGPLTNLIQAVAGRLLDHPTSKATQLARYWQQTVGHPLASHTEPIRLQNGVLTIRVDSSAWLAETSFLAPELLRTLQERLPPGTLKELRFKQGSLQQTPKPAPLPAPHLPPPLPEEEQQAHTLAEPLTDPSLKKAVTHFLIAALVKRRLTNRSTPQPTRPPPPASCKPSSKPGPYVADAAPPPAATGSP
ncbi:MAG: DUF721 domain-containing protein [Magnetococcales bacterium]|nr:DUF721 domain-containing protein [Magnetococcales bacterium]